MSSYSDRRARTAHPSGADRPAAHRLTPGGPVARARVRRHAHPVARIAGLAARLPGARAEPGHRADAPPPRIARARDERRADLVRQARVAARAARLAGAVGMRRARPRILGRRHAGAAEIAVAELVGHHAWRAREAVGQREGALVAAG